MIHPLARSRCPGSWVLLLAAALGGGGCGAPDMPSEAAAAPLYIGQITKTDALLAVVVTDEEIVAYACGGPSTFATYAQWFRAPAAPDDAFEEIPLAISAGGFALTGSLEALHAEGDLRAPDGSIRRWTAARSSRSGLAGLYAAEDEGCRTGVIIEESAPGDEPRAQGTWCNAAGARAQVTPLRPIALGDRGLEVRVELDAESRQLFAAPIQPRTP